MVFSGQRIVEMEVTEPVAVFQDQGFIPASDTVIVADVKGQAKHRALQQDGQGLPLESRVSAAVFHTDSDIPCSHHFFALVPKEANAAQILLEIFLKQVYSPVRQRKVDALGQVHVQHRDMQFSGQDDGFLHRMKIGFGHNRLSSKLPVWNWGMFMFSSTNCSPSSAHSAAQSSASGNSIRVGIPRSIVYSPYLYWL